MLKDTIQNANCYEYVSNKYYSINNNTEKCTRNTTLKQGNKISTTEN